MGYFSTKKLLYALYLVTVASAFYYLGNESVADKMLQDARYDEMVCLWRSDASRSIREENRRGWPNYKHREVSCEQHEQIYQRGSGRYTSIDTRDTSSLQKGSIDAGGR